WSGRRDEAWPANRNLARQRKTTLRRSAPRSLPSRDKTTRGVSFKAVQKALSFRELSRSRHSDAERRPPFLVELPKRLARQRLEGFLLVLARAHHFVELAHELLIVFRRHVDEKRRGDAIAAV